MPNNTPRLTGAALADVVEGIAARDIADLEVENVTTDSRHVPPRSVFFALQGNQRDGHAFVHDALRSGARIAVVAKSRLPILDRKTTQRCISVADPLAALQRFATWWRDQLTGTVIGITGSNGKTILKDALIRVLSASGIVSGSPGSFNSQIGVPLSLLSTPRNARFVVIEAGISEPGEMRALERMIQPHFGIVTNIGLAHIAGFKDGRGQLAKEKFQLFRGPSTRDVLIPAGDPVVDAEADMLRCEVHRFGQPSLPRVQRMTASYDGIRVDLQYPHNEVASFTVQTPSVDVANVVAMATAAAFLLGTGYESVRLLERWEPGPSRMELWRSPSGVTIINDSCSADPLSTGAAIRTLAEWDRETSRRKFFVFHGLRELADDVESHANIGRLAAQAGIDVLVLVRYPGCDATANSFRAHGGKDVIECGNIDDIRSILLPQLQSGDVILVKGPRRWGITQAAKHLLDAMAPNRFIIDLEAIRENLRRFRRKLRSTTRILVMVKAMAYGSNAMYVAADIEREGLAEYFGVAMADEGVALRQAGIRKPILVTMCTPGEVAKAVRHQLTPVVYSSAIAEHLERAAEAAGTTVDVHIEVDTGMGRLGALPDQIPELARTIASSRWLRLTGAMTHFASAEDPKADEFTRRQIAIFNDVLTELRGLGITDLVRHADATSGTVRFPDAEFDMVRVGIGTYGVYPSFTVRESFDELQLAVALVSRIAEIRVLPRGHRIGYNGIFATPTDNFRVGVVPIGYHDGVPWRLGDSRRGYVLIAGKRAEIIGRISMDSMVVDLSRIPEATTATDVLLFGRYGGYELRPEEVAAAADTIAYELLVRISGRVQRIFVGDV